MLTCLGCFDSCASRRRGAWQRSPAVILLISIPLGLCADNGLAITPPLGWRSWNYYGMRFTQQDMLQQAAAVTARRGGRPSLRDVGYDHLGVDMGWEGCGRGLNGSFHSADGWPIVDSDKFPNLTANEELHGMGLKTGFYFNPCWCSVEWKVWPTGNTAKDAATVLDLGFDGVKIDGCGPANNMTLWGELLNASGRPLLIEDCLDKHWWVPGKEPPTPTVQLLRDCPSNFYRTTTDILASFYSIMGNLMTSAAFVKEHETADGPVSRPGCWAYPDMLQVGHEISLVESFTHFAAWCRRPRRRAAEMPDSSLVSGHRCITSAPLILGCDLTNDTVYNEVYPIVTSPLALKVNQEWAGHEGGLAASAEDTFTTHAGTTTVTTFPVWQVWHKRLPAIGDRATGAVLLINLSEQPRNVTLTYSDADPRFGSTVTGTDVWTGEKVNLAAKSQAFSLAPHASRFLILQAVSHMAGMWLAGEREAV